MARPTMEEENTVESMNVNHIFSQIFCHAKYFNENTVIHQILIIQWWKINTYNLALIPMKELN